MVCSLSPLPRLARFRSRNCRFCELDSLSTLHHRHQFFGGWRVNDWSLLGDHENQQGTRPNCHNGRRGRFKTWDVDVDLALLFERGDFLYEKDDKRVIPRRA